MRATAIPYTSAARVVLAGHGADELFGGYSRHVSKFREGGWDTLSAELSLDVRRLWLRNFGRDDRCVADNGREMRHPFVAEVGGWDGMEGGKWGGMGLGRVGGDVGQCGGGVKDG